jgi:AP2-like factor (euAP2 lineage)
MCAVKCRGRCAQTNFDMRNYAQELANLDTITKDDLVLSLRRQSKGFCKGSSKFRGVTRHAKGKFEARIGQLVGKKYRYLGLYDSEQEAAMAYDVEAVRQKGLEAVTNFDISEYSEVLAQHYSQQKVTTRLSSKRKPTSNSSNDKMAEREFRSELAASKHVDLTMRQMKPGPAVEAEPSEHAIDTVRDFFDAEARVRADAKANADMLLRKTSLITEAEETDEAIQELQTLVEQAQTALRDSRARLQQARASRVK